MNVHLVDGTYELYRYFYAPGSPRDGDDAWRGVRGVLGSMLQLLEDATHVGVATDHVIESFRNALYAGYKTGEGMDPALFAQLHPLEDALASLGLTVWAMEEFEADDALAAAAAVAEADPLVERVFVCSPDKDLAQCVRGRRVVQLDRRTRELRDESGVEAKFGVPPASIPDWLALVGDSADGYPGIPGWGAKSAAMVLARWKHLEAIPRDPVAWGVPVRGASRLAGSLAAGREDAMLFRTLARLRTDAPVGRVADWEWKGPGADFREVAARFGDPSLARRAAGLAAARGAARSSA